MYFKKAKTLIYIFIFLLISNLFIPLCSYAINDENIYVWSNNNKSIKTSSIPSQEISDKSNLNSENTSR